MEKQKNSKGQRCSDLLLVELPEKGVLKILREKENDIGQKFGLKERKEEQ